MHDLKTLYGQTLAYNASIQKDLLVLQEAVHYRAWLYSLVAPFLGKRILEIGAGIGNYTELFVASEKVFATDFEPLFVEYLDKRFSQNPQIVPLLLDLNTISPEQQEFYRQQAIDTVVALNVLEHIEDQQLTLRSLAACLAPGGRLILILPALPWLFNQLDAAYGHFRRYQKGDMPSLAAQSGLRVEQLGYFNFLGVLGWWLNGRLRRQHSLPGQQTKIFNLLVPVLQRIERILPLPFGLSLLAVLRNDHP